MKISHSFSSKFCFGIMLSSKLEGQVLETILLGLAFLGKNIVKHNCFANYYERRPSGCLVRASVGSRLPHETLWIHFQTFEYNLLSVSEQQLKTANRCIVVRVFPPPEENIGFMNKYGILSRGSGNSYLQHSINSNLISAKTSTSGKFAILFNREMAILKFLQ